MLVKDQYRELERREIAVRPAYKLVFITTMLLTALFFSTGVVLALRSSQSPASIQLMEATDTATKLGMGVIMGLLADKTL